MLILFTILVVITAFSLFVAKVVRRETTLSENIPVKNLNSENLRPLFQPTEDEILAFEREETAGKVAKAADESRRVLKVKNDEFVEFRNVTTEMPDRKSIIEMLVRSLEFADATVFAETSRKLIELWREKRTGDLTAGDLADLLDSHIGLLPQQERAGGEIFRLREEIGELRRRTEEIA